MGNKLNRASRLPSIYAQGV